VSGERTSICGAQGQIRQEDAVKAATARRSKSNPAPRQDSPSLKPSTAGAFSNRRGPRREDLEGLDDLELLSRVLDGGDSAWTAFVNRYRALIVSCVMKVCRREGLRLTSDELMDVTGDVFLNLVANDCHRLRLYREDGGCSVSSWVGVIATSVARDYMRKVRRRPISLVTEQELDQIVSPTPDSEVLLLDRERREFVGAACAEMSPRDRQFIDLYFVEAMAPEDIAEKMQISVSTVYSKKAKLKARLIKMARRYA
jgi:RNA polymerase sigma-70 factor (ECF subfamily)